jgi:mRNA-capping enzyme
VALDDQFTTRGGYKRFYQNNASDPPAKRSHQSSQRLPPPKFFLPLPEVEPVRYKRLQDKIKEKYRRLCRWDGERFPGSEPAHMHRENYALILQLPYMVTWKPAGKRYMMLIEKENQVYMLNQGNDLFSVEQIRFPYDVEYTSHLKDTLLDGEIVNDKVNGSKRASFLINDIIIYNGIDVTAQPFPHRLKLISESIVNVHNNAITNGFIDKRTQPFLIRTKNFFPLSEIDKLLSWKFLASIPHEVEGLFFLPERDPYRTGKCPGILKWKENETIDFRLQIPHNNSGTTACSKKEAHLFLSRQDTLFATMRYSSKLQDYDNKIISCYYRAGQWYIYRLRHDRRFPNSKQTAMAVMEAMQKPVTKEDLRALVKNQSKPDAYEDNSTWVI